MPNYEKKKNNFLISVFPSDGAQCEVCAANTDIFSLLTYSRVCIPTPTAVDHAQTTLRYCESERPSFLFILTIPTLISENIYKISADITLVLIPVLFSLLLI